MKYPIKLRKLSVIKKTQVMLLRQCVKLEKEIKDLG